MLKIEKLTPVANLQKNDVVTSGKAEVLLEDQSCKGVFNITRAGTGEVAEISVVKQEASKTCTAAEVKVTLVGRITRTLKKAATTINISDTLTAAAIGDPLSDETNIRVIDPATGAALTYNASDGPIKAVTAGVITFAEGLAPAEDKDYLIELQIASGTGIDPDTASGQDLTFAAGKHHIHILSRLRDDVADSRMHNLTSFTVTKQNKAAVDL